MDWSGLEIRIQNEIKPGLTEILKCYGGRRNVISNNGQKIVMRIGAKAETDISYEMIKYAFETLQKKGQFDSTDFRKRFSKEYKNHTCRYSMTGGILVELGVAKREQTRQGKSCHYVLEVD